MRKLREGACWPLPNVTSILLTYNLSNTNSCNVHPKKDALKMLRNPTDEDVPWPGFILGQTPASVWYWCADQVIAGEGPSSQKHCSSQRLYPDGRFLKLLPMFIIVVPGMISRILFADDIACINPSTACRCVGAEPGASNIAYPLGDEAGSLWASGLMMAVMTPL